MSLTPAFTLQNMADALGNMRDAQQQFAAVQARYAGTQETPRLDEVAASKDPDLQSAMSLTSYYAAQAQTWAQATVALVAVMERYPESVRKAGVPR